MDFEKLQDRWWRLNNLYYIVDKDGRKVLFRPNPHQKKVLLEPNRFRAILKARQLGMSTACLIELLDLTMFGDNQTSMIMAHENDGILKLFRIITRAYQFMDPKWRPRLERGGGSKNELYFPDVNSRIYCDLESRGDTIQNLHISEFGLMKDDTKVKSTLDTVPIKTGRITYESTPFGINHFYELWFDPERAETKFFFPWYKFDEYQIKSGKLNRTDDEMELAEKALKEYNIVITDSQIAFRRWKITQKGGGTTGLRDFMQEYPEDEQSCFLTSGNAVLDLFEIRKQLKKAPKPIREENGIKIFKEPDRTKLYVAGADCAEGVGGDSSFGVLLEAQTREVAATLKADVRPSVFGDKLDEMCTMFKPSGRPYPLLAVERNNHGHAVLLQLEEHLEYPNLYHRVKGYEKNGRKIYDDRAGWVTDKITRPVMLNCFVDAVTNSQIHLNDPYIFNECLTLVNNEGKIEAAEGKKDDSIIASSIALQLALDLGNLTLFENIKSKIKM